MLVIIASILFIIITIMNVLLVCGLPLGEFTMGGKYKVLPKKFRSIALFSIVIQVFAIVIILQAGGVIPLWFSFKTTKFICFVFAAYLSINTIMNLLSNSKKEKYTMTPIGILAAICFWITAFQM